VKIKVTITNEEIREAIIDWMGKRGLPVVLITSGDGDTPKDLPKLETCQRHGAWSTVDDMRLVVEFEVDSYSSK
jgi:hypothetical protein